MKSTVAELERLKGAIYEVVTQRADDVCWMDVYTMLGNLVGVKVTHDSLAMLPGEVMEGNCKRFIASLKTGERYEKDAATERINLLHEALLHIGRIVHVMRLDQRCTEEQLVEILRTIDGATRQKSA